MEQRLLREDKGGVATLTLNRPAPWNALSSALLHELVTFDALASERAIRVVVLAGNGPGFCSGHDLKEIRNLVSEGPEALERFSFRHVFLAGVTCILTAPRAGFGVVTPRFLPTRFREDP